MAAGGIQVGALSLNLTADVSSLKDASKNAIEIYDNLRSKLKTIVLKAQLDTSPLKEASNYIKQTKQGIWELAKSWGNLFEFTDKGMSAFAREATKEADKIKAAFDKMNAAITLPKTITQGKETLSKIISPEVLTKLTEKVKGAKNLPYIAGEVDLGVFEKKLSGSARLITEMKTNLQLLGGEGTKAYEIFNKWLTLIETKGKTSASVLKGEILTAARSVQATMQRSVNAPEPLITGMGPMLQKGLKKSDWLASEADVTRAMSLAEAEKRRDALITSIRIKTEQLNADMIITGSTEEKIERIVKNINALKELGYNIGKRYTGVLQEHATLEEKRALQAKLSSVFAGRRAEIATTVTAASRAGTLDEASLEKRRGLVAEKLRYGLDVESGAVAQQKYAEMAKASRDLIREANKEIELGFNVEKNRNTIIAEYNKLKTVGVTLSKEETAALEKTSKSVYADRLNKEKILQSVLTDRTAKEQKLNIENARAQVMISQGINRKAAEKTIYDNVNKAREWGITLDSKSVDIANRMGAQIKQAAVEKEKLLAEKKEGGGFLSKAWFMKRMVWFAQLRGAWLLYFSVIGAAKGAVEFEQAIANLGATIQATQKQLENLTKKAIEVGTTTRYSALEAAQAMVVMGQAGLSTDEILGSIKDTALLATATLYDFKETATLITVIMKAWGKDTSDIKEITDILAVSINETRLDMESLSTAFNYIAGVVPEVGISISEATAMLGLMRNAGLNASVSATSLRAAIASMLQPTTRYIRELHKLGLTTEDVDLKYNTLTGALLKLKAAGFGTEEVFKAFERRAATGITILIQYADRIESLAAGMNKIDRAAVMAAQNLATVEGQTKLFNSQLVVSSSILLKELSPAIQGFISLTKDLVTVLTYSLLPVAITIGKVFEGWSYIFKGFSVGATIYAKEMGDALKNEQAQATAIIETEFKIKKLNYEYNRLIENTRKVITKGEYASKAEGTIDKIVQRAKNLKLLSDDNIKAINTEINLDKKKELLESSMTQNMKEKHRIVSENLVEQDNALRDSQKHIEDMQKKRVWDIYSHYLEKMEAIEKLSGTKGKTQAAELNRRAGRDEAEQLKKDMTEYFKQINPKVIKDMVDAREISPDILEIANRYSEASRKFNAATKATSEEAKKRIAGLIEEPKEKKEGFTDPILLKQRIEANKLQIQSLELKKREIQLTHEAGGDTKEQIEAIYKRKLQLNNSIAALEIKNAKDQNNIEWQNADKLDEMGEQEISTENLKKKLKVDIAEIEQKQATANVQAQKDLDSAMSKILGVQLELNQIEIDRIKSELQTVQLQDRTIETSSKILNLVDAITEKEKERNRLIFDRSKYQHDDQEVAGKAFLQAQQRAEQEAKTTKEKEHESRIQTRLSEITESAEQERVRIENRLSLAKIEHRSKEDILLIEKELLENQYQEALLRYTAVDKIKAQATELKKLLPILEDRRKKEEELLRIQHPIYAAIQQIKGESKEWGEILVTTIVDAASGMKTFLSSGITNVTGGFQAQRQEVAGLEGQVAQLKQDIKSITDIGFFSEEDAERIATINTQIAELNDQIKKAKDPLEKLREAFKEFIDTVRTKLNDLIASKIVEKLFSYIGSYFKPTGGAGGTGVGGLGSYGLAQKAHGGILPQITAFRSFSQGGITGNPTLAILGDNKSKRELVIPEENISANNVSGYMRDQEKVPITVINVISQDDVAAAMTSKSGQRVIVNTIGQDMRRNSTMTRQFSV